MKPDLDSMGIKEALRLFPEQINTTYKQAVESNIEKAAFKNVVISGMGGSSNAGKIIQSLVEKTSKIPFFIFNDYGLPAWTNEETLVVLNTYSGNTEETLSAYETAQQTSSQVIAVTSGGKAAELIKSGKIKGVIVDPGDTNPSGFPKSGLGVSFGALFGALSKAGLLLPTKDDLEKALEELIDIRKEWDVKETAEWFNGFLPVLLSSRALVGPLNAGRNALCEISRNFSQFYDFPEMNHVLIEALEKPEVAKRARYLFFESSFDHERITKRFIVTKKILDEMGIGHQAYSLKSSTLFGQCLELPHYCAWVGYNLSLLQNTDPGPEPWIIKLKESLGQPVH